MSEGDITDIEFVLLKLRDQATQGNLRLTLHAQQEMIEEDIKIADIYTTIATG